MERNYELLKLKQIYSLLDEMFDKWINGAEPSNEEDDDDYSAMDFILNALREKISEEEENA